MGRMGDRCPHLPEMEKALVTDLYPLQTRMTGTEEITDYLCATAIKKDLPQICGRSFFGAEGVP